MTEANENVERRPLTDVELGEGLKAYRINKLDWSQREAARRGDFSQSVISLAERGVFSQDGMEQLLALYEIDMEALIDWTRRYQELLSA